MKKRLGVAGIITGSSKAHASCILLGRRGKDPNKGLFVLPGGGVEERETLDQALAREVREETGLALGEQSWHGSTWILDLPDRVILVVRATVAGPDDTPHGGSDLYDVRWVENAELRQLELSPVVVEVLKRAGYAEHLP